MEPAASESDSAWWQRVQAQIGREYPRIPAWDAVTAPMIRHWCEATGNTNPLYTDAVFAATTIHGGIVAPPAMLRAWLFAGYAGQRPLGSAQTDATEVRKIFADGGYPGLIGVSAEEEYLRYLRPGDRLSYSSVLESISERKRTGLGIGYFFTIRMDVFDQRGDKVAIVHSHELAYRSAAT